jgi:hypothetical protein
MLINLIWLIIMLIVPNVGANWLMSSLALFKALACLVMIVWSRWICLGEHSHSSFALVVSCVQVRIFFLFLVMPMRGASERSKPMRIGCLIRIWWLRVPMEVILF